MDKFGKRLKQLRLKRGLTQKELAQRAGTKQSLISNYETGSPVATLPSLAGLFAIAKALGTTPNDLMGFYRSKHEQRLLDLWDQMDALEKSAVMRILDKMTDGGKS